MADVEIFIDGFKVSNGTEVKESESNDKGSEVDTFDGTLTSGSENGTYELQIDKLQVTNKEEYQALDTLLDEMRNVKKTVTIVEYVNKGKSDAWSVTRNYLRCLNKSKEVTRKPSEFSAESLKFSAEDLVKNYD